MASFLSRLAPVVLTLRGSKRMFSDPQKTLERVEQLRQRPAKAVPPASISRHVDVTSRVVDGWTVFDVSPRSGDSIARAVFLHGGCYVFEIDPLHWRFVAQLVRETGVTISVPIMPLAPQGQASVVVDKVANLVQSIIAGVGARNVSIVGDSSGGGMALAVSMELRDRKHEPLQAIVLSAPWLDISGTDPKLAEIAPSDPWLAVPGTKAAGALYRAELPETDWRVSPIHGDLTGLGPITVFTGTRDIVHADALRLLARATEQGISLDFHVGEGMIHNYPILPIPEGAAARAIVAKAIS
ncbi:alpha/beta hydrolase fold domain-containing protein [Salinibacterium sp. PAMC 21357]|uniref:alpha/beta hydrolase fold domain-containing protein n=1 Tax=Salinibacterium sp. PAMC 21357 TaxID=1112215 RepID=UPI000288A3C9|nr:alpha/beta hydrolase [Salinibacterium sp. PAMC 21357]